MDTDPATVALPGLFARVRLPRPPNFLHLANAEATIGLGELPASDAVLLALASARGLLRHWRARHAAAERLSEAEVAAIDVPELLHPAIVEKLARQWVSQRGHAWGGMTPDAQTECRAQVAALVRFFLEEITRA